MAAERLSDTPHELTFVPKTLSKETLGLAQNLDVLPSQPFLHDFTKRAKNATQRVWVQGMYVYPGSCADIISGSLKDATACHLDARLCVDYYNLMVTDTHANLTHKFKFNREERMRFEERRRATEALLSGLIGAGVKLQYTNVTKNPIELALPVIGRNNDKVVIVDSVSYFGGLNYSDDGLVAADFMVVLENPTVVETLAGLFMEDFEGKRITHDREIPCSNGITILTDSGKPGRSLILDRAVELGRKARSRIMFSSPYLPDGKILAVLNEAYRRGVDVQVVVSPYHAPDRKTWFWLANRATQLAPGSKKPQFPIRFHNAWVHAKLFVVDDEQATFGSHNLLTKGVLLGTRERSIATSNPVLVGNLVQYFEEELLAQSHPADLS